MPNWEPTVSDHRWLCYFANKIGCSIEEVMKLIIDNQEGKL